MRPGLTAGALGPSIVSLNTNILLLLLLLLLLFGLWSQVFHDGVGIRKDLKAVSQILDGRVGDRRKGSPRYPYNAVSAGVVEGVG